MHFPIRKMHFSKCKKKKGGQSLIMSSWIECTLNHKDRCRKQNFRDFAFFGLCWRGYLGKMHFLFATVHFPKIFDENRPKVSRLFPVSYTIQIINIYLPANILYIYTVLNNRRNAGNVGKPDPLYMRDEIRCESTFNSSGQEIYTTLYLLHFTE